jgi:hypothetical protein
MGRFPWAGRFSIMFLINPAQTSEKNKKKVQSI